MKALLRSYLNARTRGKGPDRPATMGLVQRPTVQGGKLKHGKGCAVQRASLSAQMGMGGERGWDSDQKHNYLEERLPGEHYLRTP